jgi:hypothetical protein
MVMDKLSSKPYSEMSDMELKDLQADMYQTIVEGESTDSPLDGDYLVASQSFDEISAILVKRHLDRRKTENKHMDMASVSSLMFMAQYILAKLVHIALSPEEYESKRHELDRILHELHSRSHW